MSFDAFVSWFQCRKTVFGAFFLSLAALVAGAGTIYGRSDLLPHAAFLALIGTTLTGGGLMKSDQFYKERDAVLKTQIDRRTSDSMISTRDLMKLEAKADKPSKENE